MLGDNNQHHFHPDGNKISHGSWTHANVRNGAWKINGGTINPVTTVKPNAMSVVSLRTTGNIEVQYFSKDRGDNNRVWDGDLAELALFDTALTDDQIAKIEGYLNIAMPSDYNEEDFVVMPITGELDLHTFRPSDD